MCEIVSREEDLATEVSWVLFEKAKAPAREGTSTEFSPWRRKGRSQTKAVRRGRKPVGYQPDE